MEFTYPNTFLERAHAESLAQYFYNRRVFSGFSVFVDIGQPARKRIDVRQRLCEAEDAFNEPSH